MKKKWILLLTLIFCLCGTFAIAEAPLDLSFISGRPGFAYTNAPENEWRYGVYVPSTQEKILPDGTKVFMNLSVSGNGTGLTDFPEIRFSLQNSKERVILPDKITFLIEGNLFDLPLKHHI